MHCRPSANPRDVKSALKHLYFALAPDEGTEAAADRRAKPRGSFANAVQTPDLLRLGFAFDRVLAGKPRLDHPLHEALRRLAHRRRVRFGERLQARRHIYRVAENGDAGFGTRLDGADYRRTGIEPDAQLRLHAVLGGKLGPGRLHLLQDRKRRPASPQRRVLKSNGSAKHRHYAVAGETLNDAALFAHRLVRQPGRAAHQGKGRLLSRPFGKGREAHHVSEQDRNLTALGFHARLPTR